MTKTTNKEVAGKAETTSQSQTSNLPAVQENVMDAVMTQSADLDFESFDEGVSIAPAYLGLKEGEKWRGLFVGIGEQEYHNTETKQKEAGKCAMFARDGKVFVHRGVQLIDTLELAKIAAGTPVQVENVGKRGRTNIFDVRILVA